MVSYTQMWILYLNPPLGLWFLVFQEYLELTALYDAMVVTSFVTHYFLNMFDLHIVILIENLMRMCRRV